jgi:hypothetical protein
MPAATTPKHHFTARRAIITASDLALELSTAAGREFGLLGVTDSRVVHDFPLTTELQDRCSEHPNYFMSVSRLFLFPRRWCSIFVPRRNDNTNHA